jgi:predicted enzyme related to lactoylglutathione lyase
MRLQLALDVTDLPAAIDFYSKTFDTALGSRARDDRSRRHCCFAEKAETWVHAPDGNRWEWYVKKADADQIEMVVLGRATEPSGTCCP